MKKYLGKAPVGDAAMKEALAVNPKLRQLAMLAAVLAMGFTSMVEAKGKPITVKFPTGAITYTAKDLKQLERGDPKTFAIVMDQYEKQQAQGTSQSEIDQTNTDRARGQADPSGYDKAVKNNEQLSDAFGNTATLVTYTDGTKMLEGDIYHGGISLRDKLTRSGEIPHDPAAKHLERK